MLGEVTESPSDEGAVLAESGQAEALADTGIQTTNGLALAGGLLILGGGALFVARRRAQASS